MNNKNNLLARLARHYEYREKPFQLSSGQESHEYLDCRSALSDPLTLSCAVANLRDVMEGYGATPEAVGGLTMGADPLAVAMSLRSGHGATPSLAWFSVRKEPKQHGTGKLIEGFNGGPGSRVLILEDVSTMGTSALRAVKACLNVGWSIEQVVALVDRGGIERIRAEVGGLSPGHAQAVLPFADVSMVGGARQLALTAHGDQKYGDLPYSAHLAAVEQVLVALLPYNPRLLAGAWLHDCLEDTRETPESLRQARIPDDVVTLVDACTDGEGKNRRERKARPFELIPKTPDAVLIKLADRISNAEAASREGNHGLLGMYAKEQAEFYERLKNAPVGPDIDIKPFWDRLAAAFG